MLAGGRTAAQTPQPFPRPGEGQRPQPGTTQRPAEPKVLPPADRTPPDQPAAPGEPTEATLGIPVYPGAQFIASYDAGRGQHYHLFGSNLAFEQIVGYYRTTLRQRGDLVYEAPAIHMFEVGRFREESMAFPPGVTVKDYTWNGAAGYLNPKPGGDPSHFRTVIQIVAAPAGAR